MSVLCEQEYVYSKYITTFNSFQLFAISLDLSFQLPTVNFLTAYISLNSLRILVKFWILNLMTKPNKPYDTTPRLDPSI